MIRVIGSTRTGRRAAALAGAVFFLFTIAEAGADADGLTAALSAAAQELETVAERDVPARAFAAWRRLELQFPIYADWLLQDAFDDPLWKAAPTGGRDGWRPGPVLFGPRLAEFLLGRNPERWSRIIERVLAELGDSGEDMADELARLGSESTQSQYVDLYLRACEIRRARRLQPWLRNGERKVVFARHFNMGGSHYAYTEALSDARLERNFRAGSALCLLSMAGTRATVETLLESSEGVIRDVDVSWDGESILFAWKKSDRGDDYGLYTMNVASREIVQISGEPGFADYEGVFLPNGDIVFNSTRCVQTVPCWWTEVSNLYTCAADGRFMRRLSFDQVHTNYPVVLEDGRVVFTRWEYNDRGQLYPQALFQMNMDGTAQQEYYGNNSWFPTTILHARGIPGEQRILAIASGHHSFQAGKLCMIDLSLGRQENEGVRLLAPLRSTPAERIDSYGQEGELFKYPYPLDERHFLVSYAPLGWEQGRNIQQQMSRPVFGLYFMDVDGRRELLDRDDAGGISAGRMVPLAARDRPTVHPSTVDYGKDSGTFYVQDVYQGPGLQGIPRGTIKSLRVVALEYRPAGVGDNRNSGPAGSALISTPVSMMGSWDVKRVLGEVPVESDGSAMFAVPARTPVYFQALDENGHAVQSMRSWATLQPGEFFSCIGCHTTGSNRIAPPPTTASLAMKAGVRSLEASAQSTAGFSFTEQIQPILDRACVSCHSDEENASAPFSLSATPRPDRQSGRAWSTAYINLVSAPQAGRPPHEAPGSGPLRWLHPQSPPPVLPPYAAGAARSPMIAMLAEGHHDVKLSPEELASIALWIDLAVPFVGDYSEMNVWNEQETAIYRRFLDKKLKSEASERENIAALVRHLGGEDVHAGQLHRGTQSDSGQSASLAEGRD